MPNARNSHISGNSRKSQNRDKNEIPRRCILMFTHYVSTIPKIQDGTHGVMSDPFESRSLFPDSPCTLQWPSGAAPSIVRLVIRWSEIMEPVVELNNVPLPICLICIRNPVGRRLSGERDTNTLHRRSSWRPSCPENSVDPSSMRCSVQGNPPAVELH